MMIVKKFFEKKVNITNISLAFLPIIMMFDFDHHKYLILTQSKDA